LAAGLTLLVLGRTEFFLFRHCGKESILRSQADAWRLVAGGRPYRPLKTQFFSKKCFLAVDGRIWADTLLTPPEAGLPGRKTRELVLAYFGTANWNSILSRHDERWTRQWRGGCQIMAGEKLSFFVA
jgi:hypothetical protein